MAADHLQAVGFQQGRKGIGHSHGAMLAAGAAKGHQEPPLILLDIAVIWHFVGLNKQYKSVKDWILYIICPIIGAAILEKF